MKKSIKRSICLLLAALFAAAALTGCGASDPAKRFEADNEILTYQRIDPERTQLVVSRTGNLDVQTFCREFEAQNPDVQIVYIDITGGNADYKPLVDWVIKDGIADIVFSAADFFDDELTPEYFENLSKNPVVQNFEAEALNRTAVNNDVYALPGPSNIKAIMYNKTLFAQYGWEVPATFDEFVSLCDRIREDTGGEIEPWNPNAKYDLEFLTAIEAITYEELLGGADNRSWYNGISAGTSAFTGHMEPYMEAIATLAAHGILREDHFSYSATARGKEFVAGKIAMININIYDADNDEFDFGYMPFPSTKGEPGYLCSSYSCFVGVPKKEHTDKQNDVIQRFLEFFASPEGQKVYIGKSMMVSNVKNTPLNETGDLASLQGAVDEGHMFAVLDFYDMPGFSMHQCALDITTGAATPAECIARADASIAAAAEETTATDTPAEPPVILASVPEELTVLDTSFYIADAYREAANADIGLIAHNAPYRGNLMKMFAGEISEKMITVFKPRSFANDSTLVKLSMTGRQLMDALNAPVGNEGISDCIYAYSGLKCEVAPWNGQGSRYISLKVSDGSAIEPDKLYTVAAWGGTVSDEFITETLETYEGTWEDLFSAKLLSDGTVTPANDRRIKLVWN